MVCGANCDIAGLRASRNSRRRNHCVQIKSMSFHRVRPTENHQDYIQVIANNCRSEKMCEINQPWNRLLFREPAQRKNHDEQCMRPAKRKCNKVYQKICSCCGSIRVMVAHDYQSDDK